MSSESRYDNTYERAVATHDGVFHCDEVLGVYMLINHTKDFKGFKIVRSRKKEDWLKCSAWIDVGGEYDLKKLRFDHHQNTFRETFSNKYGTKLSSAGLIYKRYGKEIIRSILTIICEQRDIHNEWTEQQIEEIYEYVYITLIESVDAIDNGICQYDTNLLPRYQSVTDLSSRIARLNIGWNETVKGDKNKLEMQRFEEAMKLCGEELFHFVKDAAFSYLPAREIVYTAIWNRKEAHESGQIIIMPSYCPWTEHFFEIEKQIVQDAEDIESSRQILFAIFPNKNEFFIRAVPLMPKSLLFRKSLKKEWCGAPDEQIEKISGIKGLKFVHPNGFMGGAKTIDAAITLAVESLKG